MPSFKFPDGPSIGGGSIAKGPLLTATLLPGAFVDYVHGLATDEPGVLGQVADVTPYRVTPLDSGALQTLPPPGGTLWETALQVIDANTLRVRNNSGVITKVVNIRAFKLL
jgi:hypothetical protein